jgi:flavorubredoxin
LFPYLELCLLHLPGLVTILAVTLRMNHRFFASALVALAMAGSYHVSTAAKSGLYLVCELEDRSEIFIVIENFGGQGGAVKQCVHFWQGRPTGVVDELPPI